ncbi:MAG: hypothetical protein EAX96_12255 [Candidatus Lokiarchaeota archaeon]|nr:hypothetical protein [Candidatus Lokiarchaeota archaeon]
MSEVNEQEKNSKEKYKDTFVSRTFQNIFKLFFLNGIKTLFSRRIVFFTGAFLIGISSLGIMFFTPFFENVINAILVSIYFSIMIGLIITGFFSLKVFLKGIRILFFIITSFGSFLIIYFFNLIPILLYFNEYMILFYLVIFSFGILIIIKNFHQSWYAKLSLVGKTPNDLAYKNLLKGLLLLGFICSHIFLYFFYLTPNFLNLIFYCIGFSSSILLIYLFKKSNYNKYESFEYFAMTLIFYFSLSIFFIFTLIFLNSIQKNMIYIGLIIIVSFLGSVQIIKPLDQFEKKLFKKQKISSLKEILRKQREKLKKERTFKDDDDIIIINIEEESEKDVMKIPKSSKKSKPFSSIKEKSGPIKEAQIFMFLGIFQCIFSLIYYQIHLLFGTTLVYGFIIQITWNIFNEYLIYSIYGITLVCFIAYFISAKVRKSFVNDTSMKNAFLEFLRLIDKDERNSLLKEMADTIREIMISGIIDLFDPDSDGRENISDTIKSGIDFVRRFFTGKDV